MQELARVVREHSGIAKSEGAPAVEEAAGDLSSAAAMWASDCLRDYEGELLRRGLAISAAISDFTKELCRP